VSQRGDDAGVNTAGQGIDSQAVACGLPYGMDFVFNKFIYIHIACFNFFHLDHEGSFYDGIRCKMI
jgi:hypothetical protein